jgi:hypothetical protein
MAYSEEFEFRDGKVTVRGTEYEPIANVMPATLNPAWSALLGEYGYDHNVLYISEKFGKLHALIEWGMQYSLIGLGEGKFQFPPYGLYPNEQIVFERDDAGQVNNASLNGIGFARRSTGNIDGDVFHIEPVKPVADLEREALLAEPPTEDGEFRNADRWMSPTTARRSGSIFVTHRTTIFSAYRFIHLREPFCKDRPPKHCKESAKTWKRKDMDSWFMMLIARGT